MQDCRLSLLIIGSPCRGSIIVYNIGDLIVERNEEEALIFYYLFYFYLYFYVFGGRGGPILCPKCT